MFFGKFLEKWKFDKIAILGFRVQNLKNAKIRRVKDLKKQKFAKIETFEGKLKMSLRQNALFGISGNLAKLVFPKILPAVL